MGELKGFLKVKRQTAQYRPVCERLRDYRQVFVLRSDEHSQEQACRCMDCGTPFCHWACPLGSYIPEWNDSVFRGQWPEALGLLLACNNIPEITGRVCPALCEYSCVLGINDEPVTVRENELAIIEYAFREGLISPNPPKVRTGKKVAVVGSGPAGLACADRLNKAGHSVVVFERDNKIGGILRYGIPDFKLEKSVIDRRLEIWKKEGIEFITGLEVGTDYPAAKLKEEFDALCLAGGCRQPRDLKIEGRQLKGIHFAMDYLTQANRRVAGEPVLENELIDAKGKKVVVIGGGDTGADCVGTALRQGASCVIQIELLPRPPECRTDEYPWPKYPLLLKTSTSHQEGGERLWSVLTKRFVGHQGRVKKICCIKVEFPRRDECSRPIMKEIPGTEFEIEAELVILAVGFLRPEGEGLFKDLGVGLDSQGCIKVGPNFMTSTRGVFSAGDMQRGQSLVAWAISDGRRAAHHIDKYLVGRSVLPLI
jgi:glutamate synthase (NADPH/NADH) small chain